MRLLPVLIAGVAVLLVALVAVLFLVVLPSGTGGGGPGAGGIGDGAGGEGASFGYIDSEARLEIDDMRSQLDAVSADIENLRVQIGTLEAAVRAIGKGTGTDVDSLGGEYYGGDNNLRDKYTALVLLAGRTSINQGLTVASPSYLVEKLGMPREDLNDSCQEMTNPRLKDKLQRRQVGPITVMMLAPAADSLQRVFDAIKQADPDLYSVINTAGSLCVRRIRGTTNSVSTHSFGLAVDLNVDGVLDTFTDGKTQLGLSIMADFFNAEGWVWGAGFQREDSMHFEISQKQLDDWIAAGEL